jgi:uncharacterized protein (TIRG00374 family)
MKFKLNLLFFSSLILGIALTALIFLKVGVDKIIKSISLISWWQFLIIFSINLIILLILAEKWKIITTPYHYKSNFQRILIAILGEQAISFITPIIYVGGEGIKTFILKEDDEEKSFTKTFGLVVLDRLAEGFSLVIFFLLGGVILFFSKYFFSGFFLIFVSLLILILIFLSFRIPQFFSKIVDFLFKKKLVKDKERFKKEIEIIKDYIFHHENFFNRDIFYSFIVLILKTFQVYLILLLLGTKPSFFHIYFIEVIILLTGLCPTPGSLGGLEWSLVFIFSLFNLPSFDALSLAVVLRATQLILVALGLFLIFPYSTLKIFSNNFK